MQKIHCRLWKCIWHVSHVIQSIQKTNFSKHGNSRSRHQRGSAGKGVFRNFTKFTGKHRCQSLFLNKFAVLSVKKNSLAVYRFFMFDINLARNEYCRAIYVDFEIKIVLLTRMEKRSTRYYIQSFQSTKGFNDYLANTKLIRQDFRSYFIGSVPWQWDIVPQRTHLTTESSVKYYYLLEKLPLCC